MPTLKSNPTANTQAAQGLLNAQFWINDGIILVLGWQGESRVCSKCDALWITKLASGLWVEKGASSFYQHLEEFKISAKQKKTTIKTPWVLSPPFKANKGWEAAFSGNVNRSTRIYFFHGIHEIKSDDVLFFSHLHYDGINKSAV